MILLVVFFFTTASTYVLHPTIGEEAPEIALPGVDGKIIKLSSLRGKVVLIDFWASWCRTCRLENHNLKRVYNKYKDSTFIDGQGFEIYSVSLDNDKEQWQQAIKNDKITWTAHVSDLKKWESPVVKAYNFKYLPHNVLIDKDGKVIAKSLFKSKISEFLSSRVKR